jgi:dihydroorotate dehydrogenase (fumarate)
MDLSTKYLGMQLRTPLVASASPISQEISGIRSLEDAGASAVVLYSLFEEQLHQEGLELEHHLNAGTESFAESLTYFPQSSEFRTGPEEYLNHIRKAKDAVDIPIIASLNGATLGGWTKYAKQIEQAGADAIECNIYFIPTSMDISGSEVEKIYIDILREVKISVHIPVAVKLSPFFSNMAHMAKRLDDTGADGLVLFNRFYQPDMDIATLRLSMDLQLSTPAEIRLPLLWIAILHRRVPVSLAASTGVESADEVFKYLLAGADTVMTTSSLLRHGVRHMRTLLDGLSALLVARDIESLDEIRGCMSQQNLKDPTAFERANYVQILQGYHVLPAT